MEARYTGHLAIQMSSTWREWSEAQKLAVCEQILILFGKWSNRVVLRGAYLTQGFRADVDLLLWMHAETFDPIQDLQFELRKGDIGKALVVTWAFAGVAMEAEFNKRHLPAFIKGIEPKEYVCFYPYSRTTEWYTISAEERAEILKEHGVIGREYPGVLTNGVNAFGLGDYEWLLSFEADRLSDFVQIVRRQREGQARQYTHKEGPFIVGRRFDLNDALSKLR